MLRILISLLVTAILPSLSSAGDQTFSELYRPKMCSMPAVKAVVAARADVLDSLKGGRLFPKFKEPVIETLETAMKASTNSLPHFVDPQIILDARVTAAHGLELMRELQMAVSSHRAVSAQYFDLAARCTQLAIDRGTIAYSKSEIAALIDSPRISAQNKAECSQFWAVQLPALEVRIRLMRRYLAISAVQKDQRQRQSLATVPLRHHPFFATIVPESVQKMSSLQPHEISPTQRLLEKGHLDDAETIYFRLINQTPTLLFFSSSKLHLIELHRALLSQEAALRSASSDESNLESAEIFLYTAVLDRLLSKSTAVEENCFFIEGILKNFDANRTSKIRFNFALSVLSFAIPQTGVLRMLATGFATSEVVNAAQYSMSLRTMSDRTANCLGSVPPVDGEKNELCGLKSSEVIFRNEPQSIVLDSVR